MKRGRSVLLVLLLLVGGLAAGWWWMRTDPEPATDFLIGQGLDAGRVSAVTSLLGIRTPVPAAQRSGATAEEEPALTASGTIVGDEVFIVSELGGRIVQLGVEEGDDVRAGQVLIELDPSLLQARLAQAEAAVAAAEANLANVKAGQHPATILAAQAALAQVVAQRDAAETSWHDAQAILDHPQQIDAQIVQAKAEVELAAARVERAQAQIKSAEAQRDQYQAQGAMQEKWLYRVYSYQVTAAEAALEGAKTDQAGAQQKLAALQALRANPLALLSQVHLAEQQYRIAAAAVAVAEARLAEAQAGPTAEEVAVAEARLAQAQAAAAAVRTQLEKLQLRSPIDGVVTGRIAQPGEAAVAGATLLAITNLDQVYLAVYIPEDQLGKLRLGQEVEVRVDAYPGRVFGGTVSYVAQEALFTPKNVQTEEERVNMTFAVRVRLSNPDHLLKPGMAADVVFR